MITKQLERYLVDEAKRGNPTALVTLYGTHLQWLERFVRRAAHGTWTGQLDPDEVLGETWLAVQRSFPRFEDRGPGSFKKWVTKIARRRLIDCQKEIMGHDRRSVRAHLVAMAEARFTRNPIKQALRRECYRMLRDAVRGLPRRLRYVVYLCYFRPRPLGQIAASLHTTKSAIGHLHCKARTRLLAALPPAEDFPSSLGLNLRPKH